MLLNATQLSRLPKTPSTTLTRSPGLFWLFYRTKHRNRSGPESEVRQFKCEVVPETDELERRCTRPARVLSCGAWSLSGCLVLWSGSLSGCLVLSSGCGVLVLQSRCLSLCVVLVLWSECLVLCKGFCPGVWFWFCGPGQSGVDQSGIFS